MGLWTRIRHRTLAKIHGGPVHLEVVVNRTTTPIGTKRPSHICVYVRAVAGFVEMKEQFETGMSMTATEARALAAALEQCASALDQARPA